MNIAGYKVSELDMEQIVYALLVLLIFVIPLSSLAASWVFVVAFVCAMVDCYKRREEKGKKVLSKKLKYCLWGLFSLSAVSVLWSGNIFASAFNFAWVVGQEAGSFWLMLRYGAKGHRPLFLMKTFMLSAGLVALYGIWQYCYGSSLQNAEWSDRAAFPELKRRAYSTLSNPNILGSFLVLTVAYCAGIFAPLRGGKTRIALFVVFILSCLCLLLTFSRGNWVALFCVLFVFVAFFYHKAFLPFVGGGIMVLYLGWNTFAHRLLSIFIMEDTSAELRFAYVESTIAMIRENPWGVGWYGYQFAFPEYDFYLKDPTVIMYHCHNLYLNIAAELGIVGLILFLYIVWNFFNLALHIRKESKISWVRGIACGYIASLVGIFIGGLTDYTLFNIQLGMLFWLSNALILNLARVKCP
ncbi:MAG: O-antigen ligase family protein [Acidaminococcaceae bacterium]